jgi:ribulose-5-phosphate 4-epimerase/fuculose-1-phosphate aldolase
VVHTGPAARPDQPGRLRLLRRPRLVRQLLGVVLDLEEGKRIAHELGDCKAAILRNHGLLTVGHSVEEAAWWFITMERSCHAQLIAEAAGTRS